MNRARKRILIAGALVLLVLLFLPAAMRAVSASLAVSAFAHSVLAFVAITVAWFAYREFFSGPKDQVASFAQGFGALVAAVAIFVAAGLYFFERKDKPRLSPTLEVNAAQLPSAPNAKQRVLLVVRLGASNEGVRQTEVKCMSLAVLGLKKGQKLERVPADAEEMHFELVGDPINYEPWERCNTAEETRKHLAAGAVRPLYRWSSVLRLEPGEADDRYFEIPVSCEYDLLRVLGKFRINPDDEFGFEVKDLIPIAKVCEGDKETASGMSDLGGGGEKARGEPSSTTGASSAPAPNS